MNARTATLDAQQVQNLRAKQSMSSSSSNVHLFCATNKTVIFSGSAKRSDFHNQTRSLLCLLQETLVLVHNRKTSVSLGAGCRKIGIAL